MKICVQCGREFEPASNSQKMCSKECAKKYRRSKYSTEKICDACGKKFHTSDSRQIFCCKECQEEYYSYLENSIIDNIYITETERNDRPTAKYIKEVKFLLKDFGIIVDMPEFKTVKELNNWKNRILETHL